MANDAYLTTWNTYQSAWSDLLSADERERLLGESVADDCVYTDPEGVAHGIGELIEKIRSTQQAFPGATFHNDKIFDHGSQAIFNWTIHDHDGKPIADGASYAQFGADGRLTQMTGFFEPLSS